MRRHDGTKSAQVYVAEALQIPAKMRVESIIAVGYPDEQIPPHGKEELLYEKVHSQGLWETILQSSGLTATT